MAPLISILLQSAKNLHGRMNPLQGGSYSNIFSHYRPIGDPAWFTKPNPPDTPPPILDLDLAFQSSDASSTQQCSASDCSSISLETGDSYEERKQRWIQESLPYLSPAEKDPIRRGDDLFRYWKKVNGVTDGP